MKSARTFCSPAICRAFRPKFLVRNSAARTPISLCPCGDWDVTLLAHASAAVLSVRHNMTGCAGTPVGNMIFSSCLLRVSKRTTVAAYCNTTTINSKLFMWIVLLSTGFRVNDSVTLALHVMSNQKDKRSQYAPPPCPLASPSVTTCASLSMMKPIGCVHCVSLRCRTSRIVIRLSRSFFVIIILTLLLQRNLAFSRAMRLSRRCMSWGVNSRLMAASRPLVLLLRFKIWNRCSRVLRISFCV